MNYAGNIILIEDDLLVAINLIDLLKETGFAVSHAATIKEGKYLLLNDNFDLMICDYDLPDGKGVEILDMLKNKKIEIPVVSMTGRLTEKLSEKMSSYKFVKANLLKPVNFDLLLKEVKSFIIKKDTNYPQLISKKERDMLLGEIS